MSLSQSRPGVRRSRRDLEGEVTIRTRSGHWIGRIIDASFSGLRSDRPPEFCIEPGEACELEMVYGINASVSCRAALARVADNQVAFRFEPPGPHLELELNRMLAARGALRDEEAVFV